MAINVIQQPNTNSPAHNPLIWKFQFSALGTAPVVKRMTYYVANGAGTRLSEDYVWQPKNAAEVKTIDVSRHVSGLVKTEINLPCLIQPTVTATASDSGLVSTVKIVYVENDFNTDTCANTAGSAQSTNTITIWNNKLSKENASFFTWSGGKTGVLMNTLPTRMYFGYDSTPYVWYAGVGSVRITFYNSAGTNIGTSTTSLTGASTAKYVSLNYSDYSVSKPHSALLEVNDGTGWKSYNISYDVCTCLGGYVGLMFLDPLGGRTFAPIKCDNEKGVQRNGDELNRVGETFLNKGRTFINSESYETVKVQIPIGDTFEDHQFARALLGSSGYHLLKVSTLGIRSFHKAILKSGNTTTVKKGISNIIDITLEIIEDISGQSIDV